MALCNKLPARLIMAFLIIVELFLCLLLQTLPAKTLKLWLPAGVPVRPALGLNMVASIRPSGYSNNRVGVLVADAEVRSFVDVLKETTRRDLVIGAENPDGELIDRIVARQYDPSNGQSTSCHLAKGPHRKVYRGEAFQGSVLSLEDRKDLELRIWIKAELYAHNMLSHPGLRVPQAHKKARLARNDKKKRDKKKQNPSSILRDHERGRLKRLKGKAKYAAMTDAEKAGVDQKKKADR